MNNRNWGIAGAAIAVVTVFPACKMPPRQAWQQIQTEGLAHYFGVQAKERQLLDRMRETPAGQAPLLEPGDLARSPGAAGAPGGLQGMAVAGRPGLVYSPHAPDELVDVSQFQPGDQVRCPHTGGLFYVPSRSASTSVAVQRVAVEGRPDRERLTINPSGDGGVSDIDPAPSPEPLVSADFEAPEKPDGLTAKMVPGRDNQVYSPYAGQHQIVDITGLKPGDKARCPYTDRVFVVPGPAVVAQTPENGGPRPPASMLTAPRPPKKTPGPESDGSPAEPEGGEPEQPAAGGSGTAEAVPTAEWADKPGYVKSPFGGQLVNVRSKDAGTVMRCPFSGKQFKVPARTE